MVIEQSIISVSIMWKLNGMAEPAWKQVHKQTLKNTQIFNGRTKQSGTFQQKYVTVSTLRRALIIINVRYMTPVQGDRAE